MTTESIECEDVVPATPEQIYDAWIDGAGHAAMTGAGATSEAVVGGEFTAWDGYIRGQHVELSRPSRIVQRWITAQFPEGAGSSRVEILLEPTDGGTRVRILHSEIPEGQGASYDGGWVTHYYEPMKKYFGAR